MVLTSFDIPLHCSELMTGIGTFLHQQLHVNTCNYHVSSMEHTFGLLQQA